MMPPRHQTVVATGRPGREADAADLRLTFEGERRNVARDFGRLAEVFGGSVPARLRDLLDIALAVYCADVALVRGANEEWVRSTRFVVSVRQPELWRAAEAVLARFLYVLSHDSYTFEFHECETPDEAPDGMGPRGDVGCVSLLSGGIDSFAGAAALLQTGRRPLLVAHRPHNAVVAAAQDHVAGCLRRRFGEEVALASLPCGPTRTAGGGDGFPAPDERETSQRTRSFLYMALGVLGCVAAGVRELICPENGLLAINPPLTEARVGGYSTAGTRPQTLSAFGDVLAAMEIDVTPVNPFLYQTKGELVRDILRQHFSVGEIQGSVSCWMAGRLSLACGACIACIVRAIAMHAAGLPAEACVNDPLGTGGLSGPESAARANMVDLITFVDRMRNWDDAKLVRAYPILLDLAPEEDPRAALATLRRFAQEAAAAINLASGPQEAG